jgi:hypothetical protein
MAVEIPKTGLAVAFSPATQDRHVFWGCFSRILEKQRGRPNGSGGHIIFIKKSY